MKATRDWFGSELVKIGDTFDNVVVVNCDLGAATRTLQFRDAYPNRFFEGGIAEANAIGVAAGLALEGYRPFVASFGHFLTGKFLEIFQSVGLNDAPVVLVGSHAGLAIGKDGPTQMGLRDLALIRTLPNVAIYQPADGVETNRMMEHIAAGSQPVYLRLCRQPTPEVHTPDYVFRPHHPDVIVRGRETLVLTMGGSVHSTIESLGGMVNGESRPTIANISSLPVLAAPFLELLDGHDKVVVIEDHYQVGGLTDEISRLLVDNRANVEFRAVAVTDYGQAGSPDDLYARYGLDARSIASTLRAVVAA